VLVNVELGLESVRKGGSAVNRKLDNKGGGLGDENFLLPWVPAPKSVTKEEVPKDASVETQGAEQQSVDVKTVLRRFDITVVHDDKLAEDSIKQVRETLAAAFDRYKAILKLYFRATSFVRPDGLNPSDVVKKNLWDSLNLKNILYIALLMLAYTLLKFLHRAADARVHAAQVLLRAASEVHGELHRGHETAGEVQGGDGIEDQGR
jgi:hypothetical protein